MSDRLDDQLCGALGALEAQHRLRACPELAGTSRLVPEIEGRTVTAFCSNDYLGLACHPALAIAAAAAASEEGTGAGASRLVAGDLPSHRRLEYAIAGYLDRPAALLFPSGYQANLGVLTALAGPGDLIASDALNHASLIDGCRLARAEIAVYRHADVEDAARALSRPGNFRRRLLVTESVFSMDGDLAPVRELRDVADRHDAVMIVDEAHALGVLGPAGRGICAERNVEADVLVGTLGKAFGAAGGFVAGSAALRAWLVNRARTFIYTTAAPPPVAAAARAGIMLAAGTDGEARRARLHANVRLLRRLLADRVPPTSLPTPITPVIAGEDLRAVELSARLREHGLFVPAIRPPTVPEGTARLRITLSSDHAETDIRRLASAVLEKLR